MITILAIGLGGLLGATLRFTVYNLCHSKGAAGFPWATFAVNMLGSLFLGLLYGLAAGQIIVNEQLLLFWGTGLMGSFTTFSTFTLEALQIIKKDKLLLSVIYLIGSVLLGIFLALIGFLIGQSIG